MSSDFETLMHQSSSVTKEQTNPKKKKKIVMKVKANDFLIVLANSERQTGGDDSAKPCRHVANQRNLALTEFPVIVKTP